MSVVRSVVIVVIVVILKSAEHRRWLCSPFYSFVALFRPLCAVLVGGVLYIPTMCRA